MKFANAECRIGKTFVIRTSCHLILGFVIPGFVIPEFVIPEFVIRFILLILAR